MQGVSRVFAIYQGDLFMSQFKFIVSLLFLQRKSSAGGIVARGGVCVCCALFAQLLFVSVSAHAAEEASATQVVKSVDAGKEAWPNAAEANAVIVQVTNRLLTLIEEAAEYVDDDEARFYQELGDTLKDYVDFKSFARAVMGRYASNKTMESLDEAGKQKLQVQIDRFSGVFTTALIDTYGKGLLVFEGESIEVVPPNAEAEAKAAQGKATVKQLIFGDRQTPYEIYYSLRKSSEGQWKVRNLIVESSNLGKIYRNQFKNSYKVYDGDLDKVIDNWIASDS